MKNLTKILGLIYATMLIIAVACKKDDPAPTTPITTPPVVIKSSAKDITKFSFTALSPAVDATIDVSTKTISATVPAGTDVTKLVPTITVSDKATISPNTGVTQDFSKEVSYTVTAEDASTAVWKVNITVEVPDVANDILLVGGGGDNKLYALDAETGVKKWEYKTAGNLSSSPTVVNGIVYVGDLLGAMYAIDVKTGAKKWENGQYVLGLGGFGREGFTIIDGVIYAVSSTNNSPSKGVVSAINATTGTLIWKFEAPNVGTSSSPIGASVAVSNGIVCFSSYNYNWYALDAKTGTIKWQFAEKSYSYTNPTVVNGIVYIPGSDAIYAKDILTGTNKWSIQNVSARGITVSDGILYGSTIKNNDINTWAVSAYDVSTGAVKWEYKSAVQTSALSTVAKGFVYFTDVNKKLVALDTKTGTKKWESVADYGIQGPTVANGLVYFVGDSKNKVFAFNSTTGAAKWEFPFSSLSISSCTVIDKNGNIYYPSTSGMVQ